MRKREGNERYFDRPHFHPLNKRTNTYVVAFCQPAIFTTSFSKIDLDGSSPWRRCSKRSLKISLLPTDWIREKKSSKQTPFFHDKFLEKNIYKSLLGIVKKSRKNRVTDILTVVAAAAFFCAVIVVIVGGIKRNQENRRSDHNLCR